MKINMGRILVLMALCVGAALAVDAPAASAAKEVKCANITASGSSLQGNLQTKVWIPGFAKTTQTEEDKCKETQPTITYKSTSSGKGLNCFGAEAEEFSTGVGGALKNCSNEVNLDAFVGTDVGPEGKQREGMEKATAEPSKSGTTQSKVVTVPIGQSAIAVIASLPVGCEPTNVTARAEIKSNQLERVWANGTGTLAEQIKLTKGGWTGPCGSVAPELFVRSVPSGTTAGFKRYLATISNTDFGPFTETAAKSESTEWPANTQIKKLNEKSSQQVRKVWVTPNSLSYVDISNADELFAKEAKFTVHEFNGEKFYSVTLLVQNGEPSGQPLYAEPEGTGGVANCKEAKYKEVPAKNIQGAEWSKTIQEPPNVTVSSPEKYPICTLTYDIAWDNYLANKLNTEYGSKGAEVGNTVQNYLQYVVSETGQGEKLIKEEHFAPLPPGIRLKAEEGVKQIQP
jgi:TolA-binding protein